MSSPLSKRRVVVTGLGIVSPVGNDVAPHGPRSSAGRSGIAPMTRFDIGQLSQRFRRQDPQAGSRALHEHQGARRMDAFMQYGVVAGMQAMRDRDWW